MGKKSAPKAPDLSALAAASERAAELGYKTGQEQLAWSREMWDKTEALLTPTLEMQQKIMQNNYENALADRTRYEQVFQPIENKLVEDALSYDTKARRDLESGEAMAQVRQSQEAVRERNERQLAAYGIKPGDYRGQAMDLSLQTQQAAQVAAAGNVARRGVEDKARALQGAAIELGTGRANTIGQTYGTSLQAGNSAIANMNSSVGTGAQTMGTGLQWQGQGLNATGQQANIINSGFQNKLASYEAQGNPMDLIASLGGAAIGAFANTGGPIPEGRSVAPELADSSMTGEDEVLGALTPGEYVFPKEAVSFYGTDKLNKMVDKARVAQGVPDRGHETAPQQKGTPVRAIANTGGYIDPAYATDAALMEAYNRNQGMATSAADFRQQMSAKRDAQSAEIEAQVQQGQEMGKGAKAIREKLTAEPAAPARGTAIPQNTGAVVYAGGAEPAPITPTGVAGTFAKATAGLGGPSVPPIDPKADKALTDLTKLSVESSGSMAEALSAN